MSSVRRRNTKKKRQSRVRIQFLAARATIISYLALLERLFLISLHSNDCFGRNRRRKNLPARWWSRQESDRSSYRESERRNQTQIQLKTGKSGDPGPLTLIRKIAHVWSMQMPCVTEPLAEIKGADKERSPKDESKRLLKVAATYSMGCAVRTEGTDVGATGSRHFF